MVIGFAGLARAGKTTAMATVRDRLLARGIKCKMMSFASPLRECLRYLDITKENNPGLYRDLAQTIGAKLRETNNKYFLDLMKKRYQDSTDVFIIDDVRYPNEAEWVQGEGQLFFIKASGRLDLSNPMYLHESETMARQLEEDFLSQDKLSVYGRPLYDIDNNGSLDSFEHKVEVHAYDFIREHQRTG